MQPLESLHQQRSSFRSNRLKENTRYLLLQRYRSTEHPANDRLITLKRPAAFRLRRLQASRSYPQYITIFRDVNSSRNIVCSTALIFTGQLQQCGRLRPGRWSYLQRRTSARAEVLSSLAWYFSEWGPLLPVLLPVGSEEFLLVRNNRFDRLGNPGVVQEMLPGDILGRDIASPRAAA